MAETKKPGFLKACMEFFGLKQGQGAMQFGAEMKALTPADKAEIYEGLKSQGIDCEPPAGTAK